VRDTDAIKISRAAHLGTHLYQLWRRQVPAFPGMTFRFITANRAETNALPFSIALEKKKNQKTKHTYLFQKPHSCLSEEVHNSEKVNKYVM